MDRLLRALVRVGLLASVLLAWPAGAQPPVPCEVQLRRTQVLLEHYRITRTRAEFEAAQQIADLAAEADRLRAEAADLMRRLDEAQAKLKGKQ